LGMRRAPLIRFLPRCAMPMTWGWAAPVVNLPLSANKWEIQQLRMVLLHEFAHIRRMDFLARVFTQSIQALYWWNPIVWWAAKQLAIECELACDDFVIAETEDPTGYGSSLLETVREYRLTAAASGIAMAGTGQLERRLTRILQAEMIRGPVKLGTRVLAMMLALAVPVSLALLWPSSVDAESSGPAPTKPTPEPASAVETSPVIAKHSDDAPIVWPSTSYNHHDFEKQMGAWYDRMMLQPFVAGISDDKPWKDAAVRFIGKAVNAWASGQNFKPVADEGKALIQQGCDDPLAAFMVQYFRCYTRDREGIEEAANKAFERMDSEKRYAPAVIRIAGLAANNISQTIDSKRSLEIDERIVELTKEALLAGNYSGEDDYLFLRHELAWPWGLTHFNNDYDALESAYKAGHAPEWILHTLRAYIEVHRAWDSRGPGMANTVSKEGWLDFDARYKIARDEFTAAWKLKPSRPDAASEMIGVTMTGHGYPGDTLRLWFDRAIAAQYDYIPAYDAVAWALRPRWGGTVPKMLQFARLCADTRRFDTEIPVQFFRILENATEEEDWREVYRSALVGPLVAPTAMGIADDPSRRGSWKNEYSLAAVEAYLAGDSASAADALNRAGGTLSSAARTLLYEHTGDVEAMKKEIAVLQSPAGKAFWSGEQSYDDGKLANAIEAFEESASMLAANHSELSAVAQMRAEALKAEQELFSGSFVSFPTDLGAWRLQGGNWSTLSDGTIEIRPGNGNATAFALPRVGANFELKCDVEIDSPKKDAVAFGVLLGEHGTGYYVVCGFKQNQGMNTGRASANDRWNDATGHPVDAAIKAKNSLLIRVANGRVTYHLNGLLIADQYRADSSPLDKLHSRIGIGARNLHPGTVLRVSNLQVRRPTQDSAK